MFERKAVYGIALALLLAVVSSFGIVVPVKAQLATVEVLNPAAGNSNFKFYTNTTKVGFRFNATIWIKDAFNLYAFQVYLSVNDVLLDITRAWIPKWDVRYVFYGLPTIPGSPPTLIDKDGDGSHEAVIGADCLLTSSGVTFTGRKLAAIVEFEILSEPTVEDPKVWDYLNINNPDTYLLDDTLSQIPASVMNGYYEYNYNSPSIDVINPAGGNGNFIFYTNTTKVGDRFNATIWIRDVSYLFDFQIHLHVDDTLLDIARAWNPEWDVRYVFYGLPTVNLPPPILSDSDGDGSHEAVTGGDSLSGLHTVTFTGGKLALIVEFEILSEPTVEDPKVWDYPNINNTDTILVDDMLYQIPAVMVDGYYEYNYVPPAHDVAVTDIAPHGIVVGQGYCTFFTATVQNQGDFPENITLTVYVNTTVISTLNATLASKAATTREFKWNASGFTKGPYQVSVVADPVPLETDTLDNTYVNLLVSVAIPGDIAGPEASGIPDGKVDIRDIACAAKAFGSTPIHPTWNPNADVTGVIIGLPDHQVDIRDIALIAKNFGKVDP